MSWDKKQTRDAYLARIPYGLRQQMEQEIREGEKAPDQFTEATVTGSFLAMPRPMYMGSVQGTEDGGVEVKTSPASNNAHTHTAYIDGHGNGYTSNDNGHDHTVRSFIVGDHQDPPGLHSHSHPGKLDGSKSPTHFPTPPYDGNPHAK